LLFYEKVGELLVHTSSIPALQVKSFFNAYYHPDVLGVNYSNSGILKTIKEIKPALF